MSFPKCIYAKPTPPWSWPVVRALAVVTTLMAVVRVGALVRLEGGTVY